MHKKLTCTPKNPGSWNKFMPIFCRCKFCRIVKKSYGKFAFFLLYSRCVFDLVHACTLHKQVYYIVEKTQISHTIFLLSGETCIYRNLVKKVDMARGRVVCVQNMVTMFCDCSFRMLLYSNIKSSGRGNVAMHVQTSPFCVTVTVPDR